MGKTVAPRCSGSRLVVRLGMPKHNIGLAYHMSLFVFLAARNTSVIMTLLDISIKGGYLMPLISDKSTFKAFKKCHSRRVKAFFLNVTAQPDPC